LKGKDSKKGYDGTTYMMQAKRKYVKSRDASASKTWRKQFQGDPSVAKCPEDRMRFLELLIDE
jgi:succinate dehydrogenase/fumarate reductase-like Fe-S protein